MNLVPMIDEQACAAHGDCVVEAPDVFRLDDFAVVVGTAAPEVVLRAAEACPSVAIVVVDDETGAQVYP
jgi:ferredoxin